MTKEELIQYWVDISEQDYNTMNNLFNSKDYNWSLFIGHLVIEKLLKAIFVKNNKELNNPPKTHDLMIIADRANLDTTEAQKDLLDMITTFNISTRYPDYQQSFYRKCTKEFTEDRIKEIKELRTWLLLLIQEK